MQPKDLENTPVSRRQCCYYGLIAIFLCCIAAPDAVTALGQGPDKINGPYSTSSKGPGSDITHVHVQARTCHSWAFTG